MILTDKVVQTGIDDTNQHLASDLAMQYIVQGTCLVYSFQIDELKRTPHYLKSHPQLTKIHHLSQ